MGQFTQRDYRRIEAMEKRLASLIDRLPPRRLNAQQSITPIGHRCPYVVYQLESVRTTTTVTYRAKGDNPVVAGSEVDAGMEAVNSGTFYDRWDFWGRGVRRVTLFAAFDLLEGRYGDASRNEYFRRFWFQHDLTGTISSKEASPSADVWYWHIGRNRHTEFVSFGAHGGSPLFTGAQPENSSTHCIQAQWLVGNDSATAGKIVGFGVTTINEANRFTVETSTGEFDQYEQNLSVNARQSTPIPLLMVERLDTEVVRKTSRKIEMESGAPPP